ncbi:Uma2 family endonuclease [Nostoc sp. LPT]|uniref:Uma2 family endonuclease n=1 Tax=Nostoc sp. LPT TaxID=2815387 RepID=UPI001DBDC712|nr:Uma2 family endonuclease [Nostoc sp. LPT]MBN4000946.1 Uma2 family endonuclease [Nostoc sp. LPT]
MTAAKNPENPAELTIHTEAEDIIIPPSDLWSDEPPLESDLHREQIELLLACLKWWWRQRNDFYATGNLTIYFSPEQITTRDFRGPDFFVVKDCENRPRKSWVLWAEQGKYPNVIIELLSNSTAKVDKGLKFELYQETFRTPEYFWFHPNTLEFQGFRLVGGKYQPLEPNAQGWLWSQQLELFLGIYESKLRFFNVDNQLVATPEERVQAAERKIEAERQQRELVQQQVEELKARLKELGVNPEELE